MKNLTEERLNKIVPVKDGQKRDAEIKATNSKYAQRMAEDARNRANEEKAKKEAARRANDGLHQPLKALASLIK